jgi:hypothetical protein
MGLKYYVIAYLWYGGIVAWWLAKGFAQNFLGGLQLSSDNDL